VAFEEADLLFLIATLDLPTLRNTQRGLPVVKRRLQQGVERIRVVINRFAPDSVITLKDLERTLDLRVYWTLSNDFECVSQSVNTGVPVVLNPSSRYARDIQAMASDVVGLGGVSRPPRVSLSQALISRARQLFPPRKELVSDV
jgi:pilus assembly protein CpaE